MFPKVGQPKLSISRVKQKRWISMKQRLLENWIKGSGSSAANHVSWTVRVNLTMRIWFAQTWQTREVAALSRPVFVWTNSTEYFKFNQYISERNRFLLGRSGLYCQKVISHPEWEALCSIEETPELIEAQKTVRSTNVSAVNLPSAWKETESSQGGTRY